MSDERSGLLLDTHALVWLTTGSLPENVTALIVDAVNESRLWVSPITAWEIGLMARGKRPDQPSFDPDARSWFRGVMERPGFAEAPFTAAVALASCFLPGALHRDPADRFLIATARELDVPLVTRDRGILAYAEAGHVQAIIC